MPSRAQRRRSVPRVKVPTTSSIPSTKTVPSSPTTPYTIGSPLSPVPIDSLDLSQVWSGYIAYDALPSALDPNSGILATANARITTDDYPYFISSNWADPYRVERIHHLLEASITANHPLTPADMLRIQMDVHSEFARSQRAHSQRRTSTASCEPSSRLEWGGHRQLSRRCHHRRRVSRTLAHASRSPDRRL
jgi:penicillin amidase